jgi:hypothetical protein
MRTQYAQVDAPQTPFNGIHQSASDFTARVAAANVAFEKLLTRLRGSQPEMDIEHEILKNPEAPHLRMIMNDLNDQISRYESDLNELTQLIG